MYPSYCATSQIHSFNSSVMLQCDANLVNMLHNVSMLFLNAARVVKLVQLFSSFGFRCSALSSQHQTVQVQNNRDRDFLWLCYPLIEVMSWATSIKSCKIIRHFLVHCRETKTHPKTNFQQIARSLLRMWRHLQFLGGLHKENWQERLQTAASFTGIAHSAGAFMWHHYSPSFLYIYFWLLQRGWFNALWKEQKKIVLQSKQIQN